MSSLIDHPLYGGILKDQLSEADPTRSHIQKIVSEFEGRKNLCSAKQKLLTTFQKDARDNYDATRNELNINCDAMVEYIRQQQMEMNRELEKSLENNLDQIALEQQKLEQFHSYVSQIVAEGNSLLKEQDAYTYFAKSLLFSKLGAPSVPEQSFDFDETVPDLQQLSLIPYLAPLGSTVSVAIDEFLSCEVPTLLCGNILHNGFRFQLQLKKEGNYLGIYLCLCSWFEVSALIRVAVNFTLTMQDEGEIIASHSSQNVFDGPTDGWGWSKFISQSKLKDRGTIVLSLIFTTLKYTFRELPPLKSEDSVENRTPNVSASLCSPSSNMDL